MHAQNQEDFVYKRGQLELEAGITKASVTTIFDNFKLDRSKKSPVGLPLALAVENCKQITVTQQVSWNVLNDMPLFHLFTDCTTQRFEVALVVVRTAHDSNFLPRRATEYQ